MPIRESYTARTTQTSASQIIASLESEVEFFKEKDPGPNLDIVTVPILRWQGKVRDLGVFCCASYVPGGNRFQLIIADNNGVDPNHQRLQSIRRKMQGLGISSDSRTHQSRGNHQRLLQIPTGPTY